MIVDMHVHPIFQETPQTPETIQMIQSLELTSKNYFRRSQRILSLGDFQKEMKEASIDKVVLQIATSKGYPARPVNEFASMLFRMSPEVHRLCRLRSQPRRRGSRRH